MALPPLSPQPCPGPHLTDEQMADLLPSEEAQRAASPDITAHLAACSFCRDELASLRSALEDFGEVTLSWAEQQSSRRIPVPSRASLRWYGVPAWSAALAALVAGVFLTTAHNHVHHASPIPVSLAQVSSAPETAAASPEEDDRLLLAVDREIRLGQQPAVSDTELGVARGSASRNESVEN